MVQTEARRADPALPSAPAENLKHRQVLDERLVEPGTRVDM